MAPITKQQHDEACQVDLYRFLMMNHQSEVMQKYGSVLLRADNHVSVKSGYQGYLNFKTGETGNNITYLMNFLGYGYRDAVFALLGQSNTSTDDTYSAPEMQAAQIKSKEITLPKPVSGRYKNLYAFLLSRKIPRELIDELVRRGILYQSAEGNNACFVTPNGDYLELRGTNTYADRRCRHRNECEKYQRSEHDWCASMSCCDRYKSQPFHGCRKARTDGFWYFKPHDQVSSEKIYVCEAAIDAISLYVIRRRQNVKEEAVFVSIGGVANQKTIDRLRRSAKEIVLAVDNDQAGQECRDKNPGIPSLVPNGKDWNDDLCRGMY